MDAAALSLAGEFPPAELAEWRVLVAGVLDKAGRAYDPAAPETALAHVDDDGIVIAPLYTERPQVSTGQPGQPPFVRGARPVLGSQPQPSETAGWDVRAYYPDPDPVATNRAVLADLHNGVSSLWLPAGAELAQVLEGVYLDLIAVVLSDPGQAAELLRLVEHLSPDRVRGSLGADPAGWAARHGGQPDLAQLRAAVAAAQSYPGLLPVTVDATVYHDAGATDAEELAISISVAVGYLRTVGEDLFDRMEFRYAVTANQFASIAKLRAARRVWDRVGELCGRLERGGQRQHAVTSAAMLTRRDPWVNMLRGTIACFAAAVGEAQAITVAPFDSALGIPDDFGRRIARNTQSILHDEASLARVTDAAGGSYYVETLTDEVAERAWRKFTELEAAGGALALLADGSLGRRLAGSWQRRRTRLAHRQDPITGVSEFADLAEAAMTRPVISEPAPTGLPRHRYAEDYEALRDRSDELLARTGRRPSVLLAALGPAAAHAGRLAFAANLFQAGGVQPVVATGTADELARAFAGSGAQIACLCSSDRGYAEAAGEASRVLTAAGARVWIAGPAELAREGIEQSIQLGCDALSRLAEVFEVFEGARR
ncbi:MAG TPA: methylmalonyl-CoA mutase family protein [Jatrophihabitans sp.]|nr:methylmalonyl-CoA mutase family protein [Jatrophihabitans sp.]